MATLAEVNASIAAQTQAIQDLETAMPGAPPAATEADLTNVKKGIDDNTEYIRQLTLDAPGGGKPMSADTKKR
jgi:hypothetical protein